MSTTFRNGGNSYAWTVYARQMITKGYGYPLWMPDPDPSVHEVDIGDVGWIEQGGFYQLFNAMRNNVDEQLRNAVPDDFVPLDSRNLVKAGPIEVDAPPWFSQTVQRHKVSASAKASGGPLPAMGGGGFKFTCMDNEGAFLTFYPAARQRYIQSRRHIENYLREHVPRWVEFAERYGLDLKEEDIFFVRGTTKTTRWAVSAFSGNYKKQSGTVDADIAGGVATLGMTISISEEALPQQYCRAGPRRRPASSASSSFARPSMIEAQGSASSSPSGYAGVGTGPGGSWLPESVEREDQCLFIRYFKMKRRWFGIRRIEAGAGPHELPPGGPEDGAVGPVSVGSDEESDSEDNFEYMGGSEENYDPVNELLDYILENSEALMAIASDTDVYTLFKDQEFPKSVTKALAELKPSIDIDEHGVGTVSSDIKYGVEKTENVAHETDEAIDTPEATLSLDAQENPAAVSQSEQEDVPPFSVVDPKTTKEDEEMDAARYINSIPGEGLSVHEGSITALAYSPNGQYIASGSEDMAVIIRDIRNHTVFKQIRHKDAVCSLAFSPDSQTLASCSNDGHINVWRLSAPQQPSFTTLQTSMHTLVFSPDGQLLIAGDYAGLIYIFDTTTYECIGKLNKHSAVITFMVLSPDGRFMATGGTESACYIWDMARLLEGEPKSVLRGHQGMVCEAAFSPDGRRIVTASDDRTSRIWNAETGEELVIIRQHQGPVWTVAFSHDGKRVASAGSDPWVVVHDSFSGTKVFELLGEDKTVNVVRFSPDGRYIAAAASDGTVMLWDAKDGSTVAKYNEHGDDATTMAFAPDGSSLASGSHDCTVQIRPLPMGSV